MNIYLISSIDNIGFAKNIFSFYKDVNFLWTDIPEDSTIRGIQRIVRMNVRSADAVVILLDKHFEKNTKLSTELSFVLSALEKENNKVLLPIIIDDSEIPEALNGYSCIKYNSRVSANQIRRIVNKISKAKKITQKNDKTSNMLYITYASVILSVLIMCLGFAITYSDNLLFIENNFSFDLILSATIAISSITIMTSFFQVMKRKRDEDEKEEIESYSNRLKQIIPSDIDDNVQSDVDALGRMLLNLEDINIYYKWSQQQAIASFWLAVIMCILGFALIVVSVLSVVFLNKGISESIIPMIGGAVVEIFAGTALIVYKNSLNQLNHYHKALHEDERFLSSVNLLNDFKSEEAKEEMLKEIIRNEMQMNIISLESSVKHKSDKDNASKNL